MHRGALYRRRAAEPRAGIAARRLEVLIAIRAGSGLLYLLRWYWHRIKATCEVLAIASSVTISVVFFTMKKIGHPLKKTGHALPFAQTVLLSMKFTTVCWVVTALVARCEVAVGEAVVNRAGEPRWILRLLLWTSVVVGAK